MESLAKCRTIMDDAQSEMLRAMSAQGLPS